jgi:hypothetical protein
MQTNTPEMRLLGDIMQQGHGLTVEMVNEIERALQSEDVVPIVLTANTSSVPENIGQWVKDELPGLLRQQIETPEDTISDAQMIPLVLAEVEKRINDVLADFKAEYAGPVQA